MEKINYEVIVSIVNRGHSDSVVEAARKAGARGGTIINGRGTSTSDKDSFLGVSIAPEKEVVLIITKKEEKMALMTAICESCSLDKDGYGICFSLPVNQVRGLKTNLTDNEENKKEE